LATAKVSKRKMKRHEDGKRAASIGVEQFDEWKYIYIYIYIYTYDNAIKGGDLGKRGKLGEKERKRNRERERERERERWNAR